MAWARKRTSGSASARLRLPAATRRCTHPANGPQRPPAAARSGHQARQAAMPAGQHHGLGVGGEVELVPWGRRGSRRPTSSPRPREASARVRSTSGWLPQGSSMPTAWEPWPGKTTANDAVMAKERDGSVGQQGRAPGEAAAHAFEHELVTALMRPSRTAASKARGWRQQRCCRAHRR